MPARLARTLHRPRRVENFDSALVTAGPIILLTVDGEADNPVHTLSLELISPLIVLGHVLAAADAGVGTCRTDTTPGAESEAILTQHGALQYQ